MPDEEGRRVPRYREYHRAECELLDEVRSQFDEARDMVFSMVQRSGIIMALASIVMFESLDVVRGESMLWHAPFLLSAASIVVGIAVMWSGRYHAIGTDHRGSAELFGRGEYARMSTDILNGKCDALHEMFRLHARISPMLILQIVLTGSSVVAVVYIVYFGRGVG